MPNRHQEDQNRLPAKILLDGLQVGFGRTPGSAGPTLPPLATVLLWYTVRWASFACVTQDAIFYDFVCVFFVFSFYSGLVLLKTQIFENNCGAMLVIQIRE